ncbi:MAG: hypothetical protein WB973_19265 [Thermoanaerobaculia bacterium]
MSGAELDEYGRRRAEPIRKALSGSAADVQWAMWRVQEFWNADPRTREQTRIVSILTSHARRLLRSDGAEIILAVDREAPGREVLRWRFISLAIPPSILIAATTPEGTSSPPAVRVLHRGMAPDAVVAHQHVHHAAMVSFEEVWAALRLRAFLTPGSYWQGFRDSRAFCPGLHPGNCIGGRAKKERDCGKKYPYARHKHLSEWASMIRLAFIARGVLDRHLEHKGWLASCIECASARHSVRALMNGSRIAYSDTAVSYPWPDELVRLRRKQREYESAYDRGRDFSPGSDFTAKLATGERVLSVRALERVAPLQARSADPLYEKMLLQYLRVKSAVFGLLVHPPGEPSLENFLDHFLQIKVYAPDADIVVPRSPEEAGLTVGATEYRVAPDAWFKIWRRAEIERENPIKRGRSPETGWLIHFKRQKAGEEVPIHIVAVRSMEAEADQIARYIDSDPRQLTSLRGIDICGVEELQPCWVVADTLRRLRKRSLAAATRNGHLKLQPLRLTLHAGEDFRWLTSGLRAMAEPFVWNLFQRGDRVGHGIAITLDPRKWWQQKMRDVVLVKRFDRFLDLAFLAEYVPGATPAQQQWLREALTTVVKELRLEPLLRRRPSEAIDVDVVDTAKKLWRCLGTPVCRYLIATPYSPPSGSARHEEWLHRYLWTPSIHKLADEELPMLLEEDGGATSRGSHHERELVLEARKKLIRQFARWQICIESNPSSNLVVGGLDSLLAQDFLHRRPTSPAEQQGDETLMWTISTDDPITFSTTLADEYAYAWAGMVLRKDKPYDPAYARALLDEAAATSMRTRFTIPAHEAKRDDNRRGRHRTRRR